MGALFAGMTIPKRPPMLMRCAACLGLFLLKKEFHSSALNDWVEAEADSCFTTFVKNLI